VQPKTRMDAVHKKSLKHGSLLDYYAVLSGKKIIYVLKACIHLQGQEHF
jgi:hypothetical protein